MPVLGPCLFLQDLQGPGNNSLSRGGVWLLSPITPDRECAQRGRAEGPRGVTGHRHKLLQTARNQETLKTPESFPARA